MQYFDLGTYIKRKRLELGTSLNKFAVECEIDPAVLSRIERLKQDIKMKVLCKIAKGFGMTPSEFLSQYEKEKK